MSNSDAEAKKELGNKAFAAKNFAEAIEHYTAAIKTDPKNCVYFSNRSASHAGLAALSGTSISDAKPHWESAATDAKECIKLNPSFLKGYYRLATAQSELHQFDAALATIKQGLAIEPDNGQLQKQLRQIKAKRASVKRASSAGRVGHGMNDDSSSLVSGGGGMGMGGMGGGASTSYMNLDSSTSKEVHDLQQQLLAITKEFRLVRANILKSQKEQKSHSLTKAELEKLPITQGGTEYKMYRAIGKMFLLTSRNDVMKYLEEGMEREEKVEKDLTAKADYLERRMKSQQMNIRELTKSVASE